MQYLIDIQLKGDINMRTEKRNEMKKALQTILSVELKQYRMRNGLTQEAMARKLRLSVRSYIELEHGTNLASGPTLAVFLTMMSEEESMAFLEAVRVAWEK